ncbi:MAG: CRTAC1 family protein [Gemmataceae bacterium]|nr:CRTAC1 family protein [Gemmataceae bacterium]
MHRTAILSALAVAFAGCSRPETKNTVIPGVSAAAQRTTNPNVPVVKFTDVTAKAGVKFHHENGGFGKKLLPESLNGGCAFLDFDNDGNQDLLFVNSCPWPGYEHKGNPAPTMCLFRNKGDGTFEDVTAATGLNVTFFGMGVAVGDYDNDGWTDVFITGVGGNHLFHNVPASQKSEVAKRKFVDVTKSAGDLVDSWNWPTAKGDEFLKHDRPLSFPSSTAFVDYDRDGKLDLFVCNYVAWSPDHDLTQPFVLAGLDRAFGPPTTFPGTNCQLYRNKGDGTFENVSKKAGIEVFDELRKPAGKSLGVIVLDADEDGWPDLCVANDTVRNFFFHNKGNGKFKEIGQQAGVAFVQGVARGAMGIDFAEYRPGQCAILIGNFANEEDALLRMVDQKRLLFNDVAAVEGIAGISRSTLTFGVFFFDYDLDGRVDFLVNNGHLEPEISKVQPGQQYKQPVQLFWNTGAPPGFELATKEKVGPDLLEPIVGRGCAFADIDGNGTLDVVLAENGGSPRLLKNEGGTGHNWVRIALEGNGTTTNKSALGARVTLKTGKTTQKRELVGTKGYLSSSELVLTFGLGKADRIDRVEVVWPCADRTPQVVADLAINKTHMIKQK